MLKMLAAAAAIVIATSSYAGDSRTGRARDRAATSSTATAKKLKALNNTNCPISAGKIGSMGEGVTVTHNGYEVKLCCAGCKAKFYKDPDAALKKAQESARK